MKAILYIILALLAVSCSRKTTQYQRVENTRTDSVIVSETLREDTITTAADSAVLDIPLITIFDSAYSGLPAASHPMPVGAIIKGKKATLRVYVDSGRLKAACICDAEQLIIQAKDREIKRLQSQTNKTDIKEAVPYVPRWAWIMTIIAGLIIILFLYRFGRAIANAYTNSH